MGFLRKLLRTIFGPKAEDAAPQDPARPAEVLTLSPPPLSTAPPVEPLSSQARESVPEVTAKPSSPPSAPVPKHPPPVVRRHNGPKAITIGLDYGTHSTKIVLRSRGADNAALLTIDKQLDEYPWFACPSLVRVVDDRAYFGSHALEASSGTLFRSLKVQLLPPEGSEASEQVLPERLTPDLLVAWYLSWVLGRVKLAIEKFFKHANPRLSCNLAAPMNHIENESLKTRYLSIVQAAWESVFGQESSPVQQGMRLGELRSRFEPLLEKEVPGRETRPYAILPETVAPIVSLSLDPRMAPGMYMIVDMGAGTTELSVNQVQEPGADQHVLCYEDRSDRFGGDNFEWLQRKVEHMSCRQEHMARLISQFMKSFRRVWYVGYRKDARNPAATAKWRDFHVLLTGGGARRPEIERQIRYALPTSQWPIGEQRYDVTWHEPTGIDLGTPGNDHSTALLTVAHGLSVPRQQWPEFFVPGEIEAQEAPEVIERPPAYWYVE